MLINEKDYTVISLLGHGKDGYSYLVTDGQGKYVLKQIAPEVLIHDNPAATQEQGYQLLKKAGIRTPALLAVDRKRWRILKEYIEGPTAFELVLDNQLAPDTYQQIEDMSERALKEGVNIDYFPTNYVVHNGLLYYIAYDCSRYMEEWSLDNWGIQYWKRTPELEMYLREFGRELSF